MPAVDEVIAFVVGAIFGAVAIVTGAYLSAPKKD
jgi:hypothetical protein